MPNQPDLDPQLPDPSEFSKNMLQVASKSQELVAAFLARQSDAKAGPVDPLNIGAAFMELTNRMMQDPARDTRLRPLQAEFELFWNSGGLPIIVGDVMIGAIGVGGMAPSAEWSDEICAHNALTEVLGPQPPLAPFLQ